MRLLTGLDNGGQRFPARMPGLAWQINGSDGLEGNGWCLG